MVTRNFVVTNPIGIHARPSAVICRLVMEHKSKVTITKKGMSVNAASMLSILSLEALKGQEVKIDIEGPDEQEVLEKIAVLFETNFGIKPEDEFGSIHKDKKGA